MACIIVCVTKCLCTLCLCCCTLCVALSVFFHVLMLFDLLCMCYMLWFRCHNKKESVTETEREWQQPLTCTTKKKRSNKIRNLWLWLNCCSLLPTCYFHRSLYLALTSMTGSREAEQHQANRKRTSNGHSHRGQRKRTQWTTRWTRERTTQRRIGSWSPYHPRQVLTRRMCTSWSRLFPRSVLAPQLRSDWLQSTLWNCYHRCWLDVFLWLAQCSVMCEIWLVVWLSCIWELGERPTGGQYHKVQNWLDPVFYIPACGIAWVNDVPFDWIWECWFHTVHNEM